ncbi:hypothetical protein [Ferrimicrobium sp.]|uniref:hypothetical protein n=1 Tax=Ferrimicrobium sp. TaxID=2926050 RepID=UPI0027E5BAD5|nr:hypothetical protein [Ferrimicrobium sp.]
MNVEIRDNKLYIEIELDTPTPSSSGKTLVVASTHGNTVTSAMINGKPGSVCRDLPGATARGYGQDGSIFR